MNIAERNWGGFHLNNLFVYDDTFRKERGITLLCGIDEAGRGPLAGDVYAAAVIFSPDNVIEGLNDSKKLSENKRNQLFDEITSKALSYAVATATVDEIEEINILNAAMLAMKRAFEKLSTSPEYVLIDGNKSPGFDIPTSPLIKGDSISAAVAAASVLAKVSRDRYMSEMDLLYPEYEFKKHKGYGTKLHYEKINQFGLSPIHRKSFLKKITLPS
jgi:ribonuclease HII